MAAQAIRAPKIRTGCPGLGWEPPNSPSWRGGFRACGALGVRLVLAGGQDFFLWKVGSRWRSGCARAGDGALNNAKISCRAKRSGFFGPVRSRKLRRRTATALD